MLLVDLLNALLWAEQNGLPPVPDTLHLGCSCHLHSSHHFLSTWGVVMLEKIFWLSECNGWLFVYVKLAGVGLNVCECAGKAEPSWKTGIITPMSGKGTVECLLFRLVGLVLCKWECGSILVAMTGSRFVNITPWPGGEWEKAQLAM